MCNAIRVIFAATAIALAAELLLADGSALPNAALIRRLEGCGGDYAQFSPDGTTLLTANEREACVWDAHTFKRIGMLPGAGPGINVARFAVSSRYILTAGAKSVLVWDSETAKLAADPFPSHGNPGVAAISPDGSLVASASDDKNVLRLWTRKDGKELYSLRHESVPWFALFSPHGDRVVTVCKALNQSFPGVGVVVHFWNIATGTEYLKPIATEAEGDRPWHCPVAFSPDEERVVIADYKTFQIRDAATGKILADNRKYDDSGSDYGMVTKVAFTPDGGRIVSSSDIETRIWDGSKATPITGGMEGQLASMVADRKQLLLSALEGLSLWDVDSQKQVMVIAPGFVICVAASPDGKRVAYGSPKKGDFTEVRSLEK